MHSSLFVILVDALRYDYINEIDTPFLFERIQKDALYCKHLKTVNGYNQRTVICTGADETVTNTFSMYNIDNKNSPFNFKGFDKKYNILNFVKYITTNLWLKNRIENRINTHKNVLRKKLIEDAKKSCFYPNLSYIPLEIVNHISMGEDNRSPIDKNGFNAESIFDILKEYNIDFEYLMYPIYILDDNEVQKKLLSEKGLKNKFILAQFSNVDFIGHQFGPNSYERKIAMGEIDRKIRELYTTIGEKSNFIIFGDHGMTAVNKTVNINSIIEQSNQLIKAKHGKDYISFLDSTIFRFKILNEKGDELLQKIKVNNEIVSSGKDYTEYLYKIMNNEKISSKLYGDYFWKANIGSLIHPDYFHAINDCNKGMHGYGAEHSDMDSLIIGFGPKFSKKVIENASLYDICPTICSALSIRKPNKSIGKNLLD